MPLNMFVYPVNSEAEVAPELVEYATRPADPYTVDVERVAQHRDEWIRAWSEIVTR
jgi:thiamine transport system substrate-binding protein